MASSVRTARDQRQEIRAAVQGRVEGQEENLGDQLDAQINRNQIQRQYGDGQNNLQQIDRTNAAAQFVEINRKIQQIFEQNPQLGAQLVNDFNARLDDVLENYNEGGLWEDFKKLRIEFQILVVIGALALMILIGWLSWQFVLYAWDKLMSFVNEYGPTIMSSLKEIANQVLNSEAFTMFCEAIQNGEAFTMEMAEQLIYAGSPIILSIVKALFTHFTTN